MVKRIVPILVALLFTMAVFVPRASAAPQTLPALSHKFYPLKDMVFVDFHNPYFTPIDNISVNLIIREGTGRNRIIAIGQTRLSGNMVLMPGEHASARVPIRARIMREIPLLSQFEFRITGRVLDKDAGPPDVVVQDSGNGITLDLNRDANGTPYVMGFATLNPNITQETSAKVELAILTFLDQDRQVVWSEIMPVNGTIRNDESILLYSKFEQAGAIIPTDGVTVEAKFVMGKGK